MDGAVWRDILERYGQSVILRRREGERAVKAFFQPVREKAAGAGPTPLGVTPRGKYLYLGSAGEALEAAGYRIVEEGFQGEPEEPLDCYVLTAAMGGDRATLTFAPRREDGVAVGNVCIVTLDARVVPNPQLIQARAQEVLTLAAGSDPSLRTEWYPEGDVRREAAQKAYVREPDMNALARRLERKYQ